MNNTINLVHKDSPPYYMIICDLNNNLRISDICSKISDDSLPLWYNVENLTFDKSEKKSDKAVKKCIEILVFITKSLLVDKTGYLKKVIAKAKQYQKKINYITLEDVNFTDVDESMKFTYVKIESAHQIMIPEQASGSDAFTIIIDTVKMWEKLIHWYAKRTLRWLLMLITTVLGCFLLYNGFVEYSNFYTNHIDYSHHEENGNIVIDKIENHDISSVNIPKIIDDKPVTVIRLTGECPGIVKINIPDSVMDFDFSEYPGCLPDLKIISVSTGNDYLYSDKGVLYNKSREKLIKYPENKSNTYFSIPKSVTSISEYAFWCNKNISQVYIPNSVTEIGKEAFGSCENLYEINIPSSVTVIKEGTFDFCLNLYHIDIGPSVTKIGDNAFNYCQNIEKIIIPDSVVEIGDCAFYNCENLTEVYLSDSVKKIGKNAFSEFSYDIKRTIYFPKGSYSEKYAEENHIHFKQP